MSPQDAIDKGFIDGILGKRPYETIEKIKKALYKR